MSADGTVDVNVETSDADRPLIPPLLDRSSSQTAPSRNVLRRPFRLISKDGESLVQNIRVENKIILYIRDFFTTMMHLHWQWLILLFGLAYVTTWIGFALIWWSMSALKGSSGLPCLINVTNFSTAFLLSIETQTTIGFGDIIISSDCFEGLVVLCFQCLLGILLDAIMMGVIFTKIARPRERGQTVVFSDKAVISLNHQDNCFYLMCRIGDIRKSHILEAHVRASLYHKEEYWVSSTDTTDISLRCEDLDVGYDMGQDRLFLLLPVIIRHRIDAKSPLYAMSREDLMSSHIELVINLEGTMEATGMVTQKLVSYIPDEILWGFRFKPLISVEGGRACADFSLLNEVLCDAGTPDCSPKMHFERAEEADNL